MQFKLWMGLSVLALAGCDQLGQKVMDAIPNPSPQQEQVAQAAYDNLRDGEFEQFLNHLEPELKSHFQDNQKVMKRFAKVIPKGEYKSRTLMTKSIETGSNQPGQYKISYEYAYLKNLVQYDVSFDQPGGSSKIRNLNIQVFGE
ncbi:MULTISPECIES: DUF3887 domain-containing protein [Acinetobacter]|uniref:DUF3887 domain-containing protein n=1 Tax=Acinetobacter TaxID=469 RepID=UPI001443F0F8|nr:MULTISPECIES: DUF3887 domain-containing protein [Acinetobacter]QOW53455.1 DUF3887 domain-containing protein [Acinetobacter indicus]